MKTNYLLFFVLALFIAACNTDDETVEVCEPFINEGTVTPSFALSQLPAEYLDFATSLVFINVNQDSMTFTPTSKIEFSTSKIIKTTCPNGDTTAHIYNLNIISKSFDSGMYTLAISSSTNFGKEAVTLPNGSMEFVDQNCIIETLNASVFSDNPVAPTSISQRFNPQLCTDILGSFTTNHTLESSVELNGQTYTDVLVTKDTIFGQPASSKLYFQNSKGFIAFEDEDEVLWTLQE